MTTTPRPSRTRPFARRSLALVLALSAPLGLLACSDDEPERARVESESDGGSATTAGEAAGRELSSGSGATDDQAEDDGGGGGTSSSRDEVLGSSNGSLPAAPALDVVALRLDVNAVRRVGDAVEVAFSITNLDEELEFEPWRTLADAELGEYDAGGAALIAGDTRYLTLFDSAETCLCTGDLSEFQIAPGQTAQLQAQITAPPEDVTEVTFTLPGFDAIDGLEIS